MIVKFWYKIGKHEQWSRKSLGPEKNMKTHKMCETRPKSKVIHWVLKNTYLRIDKIEFGLVDSLKCYTRYIFNTSWCIMNTVLQISIEYPIKLTEIVIKESYKNK